MSLSANLPSKYSNLKHVRKSKLDEFKKLCEDWRGCRSIIGTYEKFGMTWKQGYEKAHQRLKVIESRLDACLK